MARLTLPDYVFAKATDISAEFLQSLGISAVLCDIDNTLAPYEESVPNSRVIEWISSLKNAGIKITLISNNNAERVELFNKDLGLLAYSKCGKPFPKNLKDAMARMGSDKSNTAVIGDQLLTDAAAGKNIGLTTIIVPPINDRKSAFFRFKRALEVPTIKKYVKGHNDKKEICSFWIDGGYKKKNRK